MYSNRKKYFNITNREREILNNLPLSNSEIAKKFFIEVTTVKTFLYRLFKKFGVKNRLELLVKVLYLNIIDLNEVIKNVRN